MSIAAILLAAGRATRFSGGHKLLADLGGEPVVARARRALRHRAIDPVIAVLGAEASSVRAALDGVAGARRTRFVVNARHADGMGRSIAIGIGALPEGTGAALLALGDMPLVTAREVAALIAAHDADDPHAVTRGAVPLPDREGGDDRRPGHPIIFGAGWFGALRDLGGDRGAADLLKGRRVRLVPLPPDSQRDVDTREALEEARAVLASGTTS